MAANTPYKSKLRGSRSSTRSSSPAPDFPSDDENALSPKKMKLSTADVRRSSLERSHSQLGYYAHEWNVFYKKKALLAKIMTKEYIDDRRNVFTLLESVTSVVEVKFISKETFHSEEKSVSHQVVLETNPELNAFEEHIRNIPGIPFPQEKDLPPKYLDLRNNIKSAVSKLGMEYLYTKPEGEGDRLKVGWNFTCESQHLPKPLPSYVELVVSALRMAFKRDMLNGDGKQLLLGISKALEYVLDLPCFIQYVSPAIGHGSNSKVEVVMEGDDINYNRPVCDDIPRESYITGPACLEKSEFREMLYPTMKPKAEIPDVLWSTAMDPDSGHDGLFLLVVEIKPDGYDAGLFQCFKQLISKMHFQQFGFGLFITPNRYCWFLAYKVDNTIYVGRWNELFTTKKTQASTSSASTLGRGYFDVENLGKCLDMLARIYLHGKRLKQKK